MKNIFLKIKILKKIFMPAVLLSFVFLMFLFSSCESTVFDISTKINNDFSGIRTVDISVKTEYIKKGEVSLGGEDSFFDRIFSALPQGEINTEEKDGNTHFISTIDFEDINFLQHISIDNFSENPSGRFYAKMETKEFFFYTQYFYYDLIDMKIDDTIISSGGVNSDYSRLDNILKTDSELLKVNYMVEFPFKVVKSNADISSEDEKASWSIKYGEEKLVFLEGRKTKFLPYFLIAILAVIFLIVLFLIFAIVIASTKKKYSSDKNKPIYKYDNYFKRDRKDRY